MARTVSIGVLVDLEVAPNPGGHFKSWDRFVQAAGRYTDPAGGGFDLTVYALQPEDGGIPVDRSQDFAPHARLITVPTVDGTRRRGLQQGAGHTDLARFHPAFAERLGGHAVLHVTSCFALSETAVSVSRQTGAALIGSLHTHVPAFAEIYAPDVAARKLGGSRFVRRLSRIARVGLLGRRLTQRRVDRVFRACQCLLAATEADRARLAQRYPGARIGTLGRGIDLTGFSPALRDRKFVAQCYDIKEETVIFCFVGRLDGSKGAMLAARVVAGLRRRGHDVCLLAVGAGRDAAAIATLLGDGVRLPGPVDQAELARLYAGSDIFLFPSLTETFGNVVLEARASGLPVVVPAATATTDFVRQPGVDGLVVSDRKVERWIEAVTPLVTDASVRRRMGLAARQEAETAGRTWDQVFAEDLLPVWRAAAGHAADAS